jgi:hypothetical protein
MEGDGEAKPRRKKKRSREPEVRARFAPRQLVGIAGVSLMLGAALTAVGDMTFGPALDLFALGVAVYAAHRVGRLGPDEGTVRAKVLDVEPFVGDN